MHISDEPGMALNAWLYNICYKRNWVWQFLALQRDHRGNWIWLTHCRAEERDDPRDLLYSKLVMFSVSVANCTGLDILDVLKINHDQTHKLWWHSYIGYKCKELMQCSVWQWTYSRVHGNCSISILHSQPNIWFLNIFFKKKSWKRKA